SRVFNFCLFYCISRPSLFFFFFFFFNDTATTEIYTLSLHDALPISSSPTCRAGSARRIARPALAPAPCRRDRKSTRLNSSHRCISYAVFCLKKKKKDDNTTPGKNTNQITQTNT